MGSFELENIISKIPVSKYKIIVLVNSPELHIRNNATRQLYGAKQALNLEFFSMSDFAGALKDTPLDEENLMTSIHGSKTKIHHLSDAIRTVLSL